MKRWLSYLLLLIVPALVYAGWTSDPVQISTDSSGNIHYNSGNRRIVRIGSTVIALVSSSTSDYTYRSTDNGASWSQIDTDGAYSGVLITGADNYVYHFYHNTADTTIKMVKFLYNAESIDAPANIQTGLSATATGAYKMVSATVNSSGHLFVFYGHGDPDSLYVTSSIDAGANWSSPVTVAAAGGTTKYYPKIECDQSNNLLAAWQDWGSGPVYFSKSTDSGVNWSAPVTLASSGKANPDILATDASTYYVFTQSSASPYGCGFFKSTNGGTSFGAWTSVETTITTQGYADPSAGLGSDGTLYVSYRNDSGSGSAVWKNHLASSSNGGTSWTVVYNYDAAAAESGARSHIRYQTWFNYGGQLDWIWAQYVSTSLRTFFNTNADVTIYQQDAVVTVPNLTGVTIIGGTIQ